MHESVLSMDPVRRHIACTRRQCWTRPSGSRASATREVSVDEWRAGSRGSAAVREGGQCAAGSGPYPSITHSLLMHVWPQVGRSSSCSRCGRQALAPGWREVWMDGSEMRSSSSSCRSRRGWRQLGGTDQRHDPAAASAAAALGRGGSSRRAAEAT